jgi:hypothetical protein
MFTIITNFASALFYKSIHHQLRLPGNEPVSTIDVDNTTRGTSKPTSPHQDSPALHRNWRSEQLAQNIFYWSR